MKELSSLLTFVRKPVYPTEIENDREVLRKKIPLLLLIALAVNLTLSFITGFLEQMGLIETGDHALEEFFNQYSIGFIILAAVIIGPVIEELIFRGPMVFFKSNPYFPLVFYTLTLAFGFYHITNYEITPEILFLSPLLVAPQLFLGCILGMVRVKYGLIWAIVMHAAYNGLLFIPLLIAKLVLGNDFQL